MKLPCSPVKESASFSLCLPSECLNIEGQSKKVQRKKKEEKERIAKEKRKIKILHLFTKQFAIFFSTPTLKGGGEGGDTGASLLPPCPAMEEVPVCRGHSGTGFKVRPGGEAGWVTSPSAPPPHSPRKGLRVLGGWVG